MSTRRLRTKRRARGFTIVEVIVAMGLMVMGTMVIIGLQSHTVAVNSLARQMSTANNIAQTWIERMKQDSHRWTQVGNENGVTLIQALQGTLWLQAVNATPNVFQTVPIMLNTSGAFDFQGNEIFLNQPGAPAPFFCTGYRTAWGWPGRTVRVDVRVFWPRERTGAVANCIDTNAPLNPGGVLFSRFHTVYLSTVVKYNEAIR